MPNELIGNITINIPFNKLVLDKLNLEWAIRNIKEKRPSRSTNKPMQVAVSHDNKYYLLDGYHRLIEAVLNGETSTKGIGLNKSYEELKKMNKIGVGCAGGSGDEFCNNFKTVGSIDMIKNEFKQNNLSEQMIDGQNMNGTMQNSCNTMTINSYDEALSRVEASLKGVSPETRQQVMQKIHVPLENLKQEEQKLNREEKSQHMTGDSMPDQVDTYWHQIQSTLCELGPDFE
jgi:hypothetical protein